MDVNRCYCSKFRPPPHGKAENYDDKKKKEYNLPNAPTRREMLSEKTRYTRRKEHVTLKTSTGPTANILLKYSGSLDFAGF